jgi:hypothetical protein
LFKARAISAFFHKRNHNFIGKTAVMQGHFSLKAFFAKLPALKIFIG